MQISVPEAVLQMDTEETIFSEPVDTEDYHAMGIGPGLGTSEATAIALIAQLRRCTCPVVVDADALNILASHRAWMQQLPKNLIFTPHPRELDRLAGITSSNCTERLYKACELADRLHGYILLKGHFSALCHPDGKVEFCSTGNSGMATAGSGDVLTGIITALLARGYKQADAARIGMYLHGLAGDLAKGIPQNGRIRLEKYKNAERVCSCEHTLSAFLYAIIYTMLPVNFWLHRSAFPVRVEGRPCGPYSVSCGYGYAGW